MSIKLRSDFYDYYDHWFAASGQPCSFLFERPTRSKTTRADDLELLKKNGFKVIKHSTVENLYQDIIKRLGIELLSLLYVVVYTDEYAHAGEGKLLLTLDQAMRKHPKNLCSEYTPESIKVAVSYRYLRVGKRQFWLKYSSQDDWRSNAGNNSIEFLCEEEPAKEYIFNPIFAVDFIKTNSQFIAIDYNPSPLIGKTGVERVLTPKEAYQEIQRAIRHLSNTGTPYITKVA